MLQEIIQQSGGDLTIMLIGVFFALIILAFLIGFLIAKLTSGSKEKQEAKAAKKAEKKAAKEAEKEARKSGKDDSKTVSAMPIIPDQSTSISIDSSKGSVVSRPAVPIRQQKSQQQLHEAERAAVATQRQHQKEEEAAQAAATAAPLVVPVNKKDAKKAEKQAAKEAKAAAKQAALDEKAAAKQATLDQKAAAKQAKVDAKLAKKEKAAPEAVPVVAPVAPEADAQPLTPDELAARLEALVGPSQPVSFAEEAPAEVKAEGTVEGVSGAALPTVEPTSATSDALPTADALPSVDALPIATDTLPTASEALPVAQPAEVPHIEIEEPKPEKDGDDDNWVLDEFRRMAEEKPEEKPAEPAVNPFAFAAGLESSADDIELSSKQKKKIKEKEQLDEARAEAEKVKKEKRASGFSLFGKKKDADDAAEEKVEEYFDESYMGEEIPDSLAGFGFSAAPAIKPEDEVK